MQNNVYCAHYIHTLSQQQTPARPTPLTQAVVRPLPQLRLSYGLTSEALRSEEDPEAEQKLRAALTELYQGQPAEEDEKEARLAILSLWKRTHHSDQPEAEQQAAIEAIFDKSTEHNKLQICQLLVLRRAFKQQVNLPSYDDLILQLIIGKGHAKIKGIADKDQFFRLIQQLLENLYCLCVTQANAKDAVKKIGDDYLYEKGQLVCANGISTKLNLILASLSLQNGPRQWLADARLNVWRQLAADYGKKIQANLELYGSHIESEFAKYLQDVIPRGAELKDIPHVYNMDILKFQENNVGENCRYDFAKLYNYKLIFSTVLERYYHFFREFCDKNINDPEVSKTIQKWLQPFYDEGLLKPQDLLGYEINITGQISVLNSNFLAKLPDLCAKLLYAQGLVSIAVNPLTDVWQGMSSETLVAELQAIANAHYLSVDERIEAQYAVLAQAVTQPCSLESQSLIKQKKRELNKLGYGQASKKAYQKYKAWNVKLSTIEQRVADSAVQIIMPEFGLVAKPARTKKDVADDLQRLKKHYQQRKQAAEQFEQPEKAAVAQKFIAAIDALANLLASNPSLLVNLDRRYFGHTHFDRLAEMSAMDWHEATTNALNQELFRQDRSVFDSDWRQEKGPELNAVAAAEKLAKQIADKKARLLSLLVGETFDIDAIPLWLKLDERFLTPGWFKTISTITLTSSEVSTLNQQLAQFLSWLGTCKNISDQQVKAMRTSLVWRHDEANWPKVLAFLQQRTEVELQRLCDSPLQPLAPENFAKIQAYTSALTDTAINILVWRHDEANWPKVLAFLQQRTEVELQRLCDSPLQPLAPENFAKIQGYTSALTDTAINILLKRPTRASFEQNLPQDVEAVLQAADLIGQSKRLTAFGQVQAQWQYLQQKIAELEQKTTAQPTSWFSSPVATPADNGCQILKAYQSQLTPYLGAPTDRLMCYEIAQQEQLLQAAIDNLSPSQQQQRLKDRVADSTIDLKLFVQHIHNLALFGQLNPRLLNTDEFKAVLAMDPEGWNTDQVTALNQKLDTFLAWLDKNAVNEGQKQALLTNGVWLQEEDHWKEVLAFLQQRTEVEIANFCQSSLRPLAAANFAMIKNYSYQLTGEAIKIVLSRPMPEGYLVRKLPKVAKEITAIAQSKRLTAEQQMAAKWRCIDKEASKISEQSSKALLALQEYQSRLESFGFNRGRDTEKAQFCYDVAQQEQRVNAAIDKLPARLSTAKVRLKALLADASVNLKLWVQHIDNVKYFAELDSSLLSSDGFKLILTTEPGDWHNARLQDWNPKLRQFLNWLRKNKVSPQHSNALSLNKVWLDTKEAHWDKALAFLGKRTEAEIERLGASPLRPLITEHFAKIEKYDHVLTGTAISILLKRPIAGLDDVDRMGRSQRLTAQEQVYAQWQYLVNELSNNSHDKKQKKALKSYQSRLEACGFDRAHVGKAPAYYEVARYEQALNAAIDDLPAENNSLANIDMLKNLVANAAIDIRLFAAHAKQIHWLVQLNSLWLKPKAFAKVIVLPPSAWSAETVAQLNRVATANETAKSQTYLDIFLTALANQFPAQVEKLRSCMIKIDVSKIDVSRYENITAKLPLWVLLNDYWLDSANFAKLQSLDSQWFSKASIAHLNAVVSAMQSLNLKLELQEAQPEWLKFLCDCWQNEPPLDAAIFAKVQAAYEQGLSAKKTKLLWGCGKLTSLAREHLQYLNQCQDNYFQRLINHESALGSAFKKIRNSREELSSVQLEELSKPLASELEKQYLSYQWWYLDKKQKHNIQALSQDLEKIADATAIPLTDRAALMVAKLDEQRKQLQDSGSGRQRRKILKAYQKVWQTFPSSHLAPTKKALVSSFVEARHSVVQKLQAAERIQDFTELLDHPGVIWKLSKDTALTEALLQIDRKWLQVEHVQALSTLSQKLLNDEAFIAALNAEEVTTNITDFAEKWLMANDPAAASAYEIADASDRYIVEFFSRYPSHFDGYFLSESDQQRFIAAGFGEKTLAFAEFIASCWWIQPNLNRASLDARLLSTLKKVYERGLSVKAVQTLWESGRLSDIDEDRMDYIQDCPPLAVSALLAHPTALWADFARIERHPQRLSTQQLSLLLDPINEKLQHWYCWYKEISPLTKKQQKKIDRLCQPLTEIAQLALPLKEQVHLWLYTLDEQLKTLTKYPHYQKALGYCCQQLLAMPGIELNATEETMLVYKARLVQAYQALAFSDGDPTKRRQRFQALLHHKHIDRLDTAELKTWLAASDEAFCQKLEKLGVSTIVPVCTASEQGVGACRPHVSQLDEHGDLMAKVAVNRESSESCCVS